MYSRRTVWAGDSCQGISRNAGTI